MLLDCDHGSWIKQKHLKHAKTQHVFHFHVYSQQGVSGIMVSIAAFQAVDLGSIPGLFNFYF